MAKLLIRSAALAAAFAVSGSLWASCGSGGYCGGAIVTQLEVSRNGRVIFGVEGEVSTSCKWFGREFRIELNSSDPDEAAASRAQYSALLSYVGQRKQVNLWFSPIDASLQGTDCGQGDIALVNSLSAVFDTTEFDTDGVATDEYAVPPASAYEP